MWRVFVLFITLYRLPFPSFVYSQKLSTNQQNTLSATRNYDEEVALIIDRVLVRGEGNIGNIKTQIWVPPSEEDYQQILAIGSYAISPLNKRLDSSRPFQQLLIVRLLGALGGSDIVSPLKRALEPQRANSVRMASLAALRNVPDSLAIPIITNFLHDSDPLVATRAKNLLDNYYGLVTPK